MAEMKIYNTLTRDVEQFVPIRKDSVGLYTCGPTVYGHPHLGNLRTYIFEDVLRRTLEYFGYNVKHVMNITDVGHLTSDADSGEDKMQVGARREGKTAWDVAERYTEIFLKDIARLNIERAHILCKATAHIAEQVALIAKLESKGYTYNTQDGVYYDTSKFSDYAHLARLNLEGLRAGARIALSDGKKNKTDFALWKFSKPEDHRDMEWDSPWGRGFPGWHIECSAMSTKYLGEQFDIHAGGIDHISIHHTNEIAQTEAATGKKPWVKYWVHGEFLVVDKEKMSKSKGDTLSLDTLIEKGLDPIAYRYFCLGGSYRKQLNFSWDALENAQRSYDNLKRQVLDIKDAVIGPPVPYENYIVQFENAVADDLNTAVGLSVLWTTIKDETLSPEHKYGTVLQFDKVLGFDIENWKRPELDVPEELNMLLVQRALLRKDKKWAEADIIRKKIAEAGYDVLDTLEGPRLKKA